MAREAASGQPPGPQDHDPQAVPPTAAGLEPAAPRALLASARGRVARSPVETEEKARAPGTGPPLWEAGGRGGQPSACSTFSRFRGLPDGQGAAWEWDDAGGRKAPGSRPTWRPSRRAPLAARPPLPHSERAPKSTLPPSNSLWRKDAGTATDVSLEHATRRNPCLPGRVWAREVSPAPPRGPRGLARTCAWRPGRRLRAASGSTWCPAPAHVHTTGYRCCKVNTEFEF